MKKTPKKVSMKSKNYQEDLLGLLMKNFPQVFKDGKVDYKALKKSLGESIEEKDEIYGLNWAGKNDCFREIQLPTTCTLIPEKKESVNFDKTENIFIQGDNLEVLKVLQRSYYGKIKMIYIDPPYNTGNDFVYNDKFKETQAEYKKRSGKTDACRQTALMKNTKDSGHFHSNWLNMMHPRLFLARNLLREDGVIFVSIDDTESANLRLLMNEIFGEENFIGNIAWKKTSGDNKPSFAYTHDNILVFGRNTDKLPRITLTAKQRAQYKNTDNDPRGDWAESDYRSKWNKSERPNLYYAIVHPSTGEEIYPDTFSDSPRVWACSEETHKKNVKDGLIWWGKNNESKEPKKKRFLKQHKGANVRSIWTDAGSNDFATKEQGVLFPGYVGLFDNPKPTTLLKKMIRIFEQDAIILDFFAGSGTTAHAVMALNAEDGGNRKCISVQLDEETDKDSEAYRAGYKNIAQLARERIRRAGKQIQKEHKGKKDLDIGFKAFKLHKSNFKIWNQDVKDEKDLIKQMQMSIDSLDKHATTENILFELILKAGLQLNVDINKKVVRGKSFYLLDEAKLAICLEDKLLKPVVEAIINEKPLRFICLEKSFSRNDQLKTNTLLKMEQAGIDFRVV